MNVQVTIENGAEFTAALMRVLMETSANVVAVSAWPLLQARASEYLNDANAKPNVVSTSDKLYRRKGDLLRTFVRGKRGNISSVKISGDDVVYNFGIDTAEIVYAAVHEYGARITITAKMRRFFWAKWFETGADMWRALALTKKAFVTIPARPYFAPALAKFFDVDVPYVLADVVAAVNRKFTS